MTLRTGHLFRSSSRFFVRRSFVRLGLPPPSYLVCKAFDPVRFDETESGGSHRFFPRGLFSFEAFEFGRGPLRLLEIEFLGATLQLGQRMPKAVLELPSDAVGRELSV